MGKNGARAPRNGAMERQIAYERSRTIGGFSNMSRIASVGAGIFGAFWAVLVVLWWIVKVVAFVIFIIAIVAILGALLNNNTPETHDIIWAIIAFIAVWVL